MYPTPRGRPVFFRGIEVRKKNQCSDIMPITVNHEKHKAKFKNLSHKINLVSFVSLCVCVSFTMFSVSGLCSVEYCDDWLKMNWKGFGKKQLCPNRGTIPVLPWKKTTTKIISPYSRCLCLGSNREFPESKSRALSLRQPDRCLFVAFINVYASWDSSVVIATGYGLYYRAVKVRVPKRPKIFSSPCRPDRLWSSPSLLSSGHRELFPPGLKPLGREADHSPTNSAEVKKMWIYTSSVPYISWRNA
jgi:hypothetical protein